MSSHSTLLQRLLSWTISTKKHAGINKALSLARICLLVWNGSRCDGLHQEMPDMHQSAVTSPLRPCTLHKVPPGPWVKIGVDFFQDHFGKKHLIIADYFNKFPYVFPVASPHHFKIYQPPQGTLCNFATEGIPTIMISDIGSPFNGDDFKKFAHEFDFVYTTSSLHFHQSTEFIEAIMKKVKNVCKKTDGSPNAQVRALLQL